MRPWLKAGLIGGGVLSALTVLSYLLTQLPAGVGGLISCCLCFPLILLAYPGTGALAALWLSPPRTAGDGAKEGALAGVVAGAIDGLIGLILTLAAGAGMYQQALQQLPPESWQALQETGLANLFTSTGGLAGLSCCGGLVGILWAAAMGAAGGAILAAAKRDSAFTGASGNR
ncbi:MAG: hypothetical protein ACUVSG_05195 [Anaerolineae bacterium]